VKVRPFQQYGHHGIPAGSGQRGIALVLVLWAVTLLMVIAGSFAFSVRTQTQLTGNLVSIARARALADAGVYRGVFELMRPATDGGRWKANGFQHPFDLEGEEVVVTLRPEAAKIDLNAANDALLKGLLLSAGIGAEEAARLLDEILDWRDPDDLSRPLGAEREQYLAAGLSYVPANAPFRSVDELRLILGMPAGLFRRISGALTVFSGQSGIDSTTASRAVLLAIPGATAEDVDAYLARRQAELAQGQDPEPFPLAAAYTVAHAGQVYNIESVARLRDGTSFTRDAVASLTQDPKHPFVFLSWKAS
jgi:general secretion pathway protein K